MAKNDPEERPAALVFPPDPQEKASDVVNRIFAAFGLSDEFPPNVMDQVDALLCNEGTEDPTLVDLTTRPYITIDNDDSMDLDQAMWICRADPPPKEEEFIDHLNTNVTTSSSPQGYLVSYSLADGAYYVPAGSPIFHHAVSRGGVSFYLPGRAIPMLPRKLSEDVMSLNEGVHRRSLTFDMYLDKDGHVIRTLYCWAVIQSRWKGSYREVAQYYGARDADRDDPLAHQDYTETLDLLREIGIKRRILANARHVVQYHHRDDLEIRVDRNGRLCFGKETRYSSEIYNEQISLLVNAEGARLLKEFMHDQQDFLHPIFRSQSGPSERQLVTLESIIQDIVEMYKKDPAIWAWKRSDGEHLSDYLGRIYRRLDELPSDSKETAEALVKVIERQAMITNVAAEYTNDPADSVHFSLKLEQYSRFSSPMREIVGCFTHKEFQEAVRGKQTEGISIDQDIRYQKDIIRTARKSKQTQKKISAAVHLHMMNCLFFKDLNIHRSNRPVYNGIILGMDFSERSKSPRVYVKLQEPPIEIKVAGEDLNYEYECRYAPTGDVFGRHGTTVEIAPLEGSFDPYRKAVPSFRSGQRVNIQVDDYAQYFRDTSRSRWIFAMRPTVRVGPL